MRRPKLSSVIIVVTLFLFFLFLSFPFENLKGLVFSKIYNLTNILIVADDMSLTFFGWPGFSLKNVNVTLPLGENEIELASEKLIFRVGIGGLFPPAPSASMNLKNLKKGGNLFMKFSEGGSHVSATVDGSDVNLSQLAFPGLSRPLEGRVSSDVDLKIDRTDLGKSTGRVELKGEGIQTPSHLVEGMPGVSFAIPGLKIGRLETIINLKGGTAEFTSIKFGDANSDLSGSINGEMKLGQDLMRSHLNLVLRLQLAAKIVQDPQNKTFVSFLETYQIKPGEYGMRWNASVAELSGLSIKVLPDKLMN